MEQVLYNEQLLDLIEQDEEISHFCSTINDIGIVLYEEEDFDECFALAHYLLKNEMSDIVHNILLLGANRNNVYSQLLKQLFPKSKVVTKKVSWKNYQLDYSDLCNLLIINILPTDSIPESITLFNIGSVAHIKDFINDIRCAYTLNISRNKKAEDCSYQIEKNFSLKNISFNPKVSPSKEISKFCLARQENLLLIKKTLTPKTIFFQSYEEMRQGCATCCLCSNYKSTQSCPLGQKAIAECYRKGIFVPKDERIAHQWEVLAAKQGLKSSEIQVADDYYNGFGCISDKDRAFQIYHKYAKDFNDTYCIQKIIKMNCDKDLKRQIRSIPFIVQAAKNGDEQMILKLADAFKNGDMGLPIDMQQQKQWIEEGAEQGNSIFIKAMAEMYEDYKLWKECYEWYQKLQKKVPDSISMEKLEEIELLMLTDGQSIEDVATSGNHYLHGYFGKKRDTFLAYRCLSYASKHNNPEATGLLGKMYYKGIEVEEDRNKGIQLLTQAAESDDLLSMDLLIDIYFDSDIEYNDSKWDDIIVEKIESSISKGIAFAFYLKAHYIKIGYKYNLEKNESIQYMRIAAEKDIPQAQFELYELYEDLDKDKAAYWLEKAAETGDYRAQGKLGMRLSQDWIKRNEPKTFEMLKNAYLQEYEEVTWVLAKAFIYGWGTTKDLKMGFDLTELAAYSGVPEAEEMLCEEYYKGNEVLSKDYDLCIKWGERAISHGKKRVRFQVAYASSHIGNHDRAKELYFEMSNEGDGAAMNNYACELSDSQEKVEWFQKAADAGDDYGCWNLAKKLRDGEGVERNIEKAIFYFEQSAKEGNVHAMNDLAKVYLKGNGIDKDIRLSLEWYEKSAEKEDVDAMLAIGRIYQYGNGLDKNINEAIRYYKMAAEKENCNAFLCLAKIYEEEVSTLDHLDSAIFWYRKAAEKGNAVGKDNLVRLGSSWIENGKVVNEFIEEQDDDLPF